MVDQEPRKDPWKKAQVFATSLGVIATWLIAIAALLITPTLLRTDQNLKKKWHDESVQLQQEMIELQREKIGSQREDMALQKKNMEFQREIYLNAISKNESKNIDAMERVREMPEEIRENMEEPLLNAMDSEGNTALVRKKAKRRKMELALDKADTFFGVEHFEKAASAYEEATKFITDWEIVDSRILEEAHENVEENPERAGKKYQRFFAPLR
uniref:Uncharacterized protein n=1 Tax=Candidatus Kentrum sp. DK TaxID=2126562 RepID=A0A450SJE0_9GAMM|nr:MAG: hypothetical protein BECKDK2373B_GA0170837_104233 [Candidatus Kentron sp. DK]